MTITKRTGALSAEQFQDFWRCRIRAGTLKEVAEKLDTPYPTVRAWNYGKNPVPGIAKVALGLWEKNTDLQRRIEAIRSIADDQELPAKQALREIKDVLDEPEPPAQPKEDSLWQL